VLPATYLLTFCELCDGEINYDLVAGNEGWVGNYTSGSANQLDFNIIDC
jgi:hypothetical protein